jgi:L-lactate utilization protein LutB
MTGANFVVAETGTFVVCTNEGNADLSGNVPKLHIASIGIEKIIPRLEHLAVFVRLLSRSALGSPMTQYTSHFRGPRAGGEMHVVLVDNGRSERLGLEEFWTSLKCIRCGACMNTCPVYRRSGGLSYGATYSGPIGLIIDPTFNAHKYSNLPFASSLNGSCSNVCPVKINIHEQIYAWRRELVKRHEVPLAKKAAMKAAGELLSRPAAYRAAMCSTAPEIIGNRDIASVSGPRELADVDFAIARASLAVAETGSVLLTEADLGINALAYLAQHLIVLIDPADIVVNIHHAYRRPEFRSGHYASFHTGPSATADIEGVLIHGAQGVRSLCVLPVVVHDKTT